MSYIDTNVYVRIRPFAQTGYHGQAKLAADKGIKLGNVNKKIDSYTEDEIKILDEGSGKLTNFSYPKKVIPPNDSQEKSFISFGMPGLIDKFLEGNSCHFLAYGQTGSGKTHTMFGPPNLADEIKSADLEGIDLKSGKGFPESWGLFARTILSCMSRMKANAANSANASGSTGTNSSMSFTFTATVIELYMFQVYDLLNDKKVIPTAPGEFDFKGITVMKISNLNDVAELARTVMSKRRSSSTNVNDSSSRSHCIATLNLVTVSKNGTGVTGQQQVRKNSFTFADLSGSERVSKTGFEKAQQGGFEGICINYELYQMGMTIDQIVTQQKIERNGKVRKKIKNNFSMLANIISGALDGASFCNMVICLSQSDNNGSESWSSLNFGARMAKLRPKCPVGSKWEDLVKKIEILEKDLGENERAIQSIHSSNPYYPKREARIKMLSEELEFLRSVLE